MRVGIYDKNGNGVYDNNGEERWGFHWMYQTSTGEWAEKQGVLASNLVSGSSGTSNPSTYTWGNSALAYTSSCVYYYITV